MKVIPDSPPGTGEKSIDYKRETKHQILDVDPCTDNSQPHKGPLMELLFVNKA